MEKLMSRSIDLLNISRVPNRFYEVKKPLPDIRESEFHKIFKKELERGHKMTSNATIDVIYKVPLEGNETDFLERMDEEADYNCAKDRDYDGEYFTFTVNTRVYVSYTYDPGVRTYANGDPGYPPSIDIDDIEEAEDCFLPYDHEFNEDTLVIEGVGELW